jgi:hypothetical protein
MKLGKGKSHSSPGLRRRPVVPDPVACRHDESDESTVNDVESVARGRGSMASRVGERPAARLGSATQSVEARPGSRPERGSARHPRANIPAFERRGRGVVAVLAHLTAYRRLVRELQELFSRPERWPGKCNEMPWGGSTFPGDEEDRPCWCGVSS